MSTTRRQFHLSISHHVRLILDTLINLYGKPTRQQHYIIWIDLAPDPSQLGRIHRPIQLVAPVNIQRIIRIRILIRPPNPLPLRHLGQVVDARLHALSPKRIIIGALPREVQVQRQRTVRVRPARVRGMSPKVCKRLDVVGEQGDAAQEGKLGVVQRLVEDGLYEWLGQRGGREGVERASGAGGELRRRLFDEIDVCLGAC